MREFQDDPASPAAGGPAAGGPAAGGPAAGPHSRGASGASCLPGPRGEALAQAESAVALLLEMLESEPAPAAEILVLTARLGKLVTRAQAAHTIAVGQAKSSGMWGVDGYASSASWLRFTHLLDGPRALSLERSAAWLDLHPLTRAAFVDGRITTDHVAALRRVTESCPRREDLYPRFEKELLTIAANSNPRRTATLLRAWADAVDATTANTKSRKDYDRRALYLSPVGDGWDVRGWLPAAIGAELAGLLNETMEQNRRASDDHALDPPSAQRLDALMDLARAAAAAGNREGTGMFLSNGARHRARVVVTVPIGRLVNRKEADFRSGRHTAPISQNLPDDAAERGSQDLPHDPADCSGSWQCFNGPGDGFLAFNEVMRLSCDGEIQRLLIGPKSQPLDIGRSTRVVPDHIRTALHRRDQGCVMPGCQRPSGWCEAHHIKHWSDGGSTAVQNLALICSRHHHELHNEKWRVRMVDGIPEVRRR